VQDLFFERPPVFRQTRSVWLDQEMFLARLRDV
jgi:hypothetical protein